MKLERQVSLFYRKGTSDKIYEVDLCSVDEGAYVVNFRYGPSGGKLRHGSKTPLPVGLAEAEKIFDKLVADKSKKGYLPQTAAGTGETQEENTGAVSLPPEIAAGLSPADHAVLEQCLLAAQNLTRKGGRTLTRLLWRVGERRINGAQDAVRPLLKSKDDRLIHTCCWTIARCEYRELLPLLTPILEQNKRPLWLKRWIQATVRMLASPEERDQETVRFTETLSAEICDALRGDAVTSWFLDTYQAPNYKKCSLLYELYYHDVPHYRPALLQLLAALPLKPPFWPHLRAIFKTAILREDWDTFALLGYRIHTGKALYAVDYVNIDWDWIQVHGEVKKPTSRIGFTHRTRASLMKRVWRELARAARDQPERFVAMAVPFLLCFRDGDDKKPVSKNIYSWETRSSYWLHYPPFADHFAFAKLLFGGSHRFQWTKSARLRYQSQTPQPDADEGRREELFGDLWDRYPEALVTLLARSGHHEVHRFAVRVLRDNPDCHSGIADDRLVAWLAVPYTETQTFALELIEKRLQPEPFPTSLLTSLLGTDIEAAHTLAVSFMRTHAAHVRRLPALLVKTLLHPADAVRGFAGELLAGQVWSLEDQETIGDVLLAAVAGLDGETSHELLDAVYHLTTPSFATFFRRVELARLLRLLEHPAAAVQRFAGRLFHDHETPVDALPQSVFSVLLDAEDPMVRATGVALLGKLPVETLLEMDGLILAAVLSSHAAVRHAAVPLVERAAAGHRGFATLFAQTLCRHLLRKVADETQHADMAHLLVSRLGAVLADLDRDLVWKMIRSQYSHARRAASEIVATCWSPSELSVREWVLLAHSDQLRLRQYGCKACAEGINHLLEELAEAVRLPDTDWEDTREAAFALFRTDPVFSAWEPVHLVALCDSIRPEVRAFGYELLTARFQNDQGPEFLLKLSEHPTADMQLLASNWLLAHAEKTAEGLRKLKPYLTTVLMRVNQSRVAKTRIYAFLAGFSADQDCARVVRDILAPLSQTIAVGDRDRCIAILHELENTLLDVPTPIRIINPPIRQRRTRGV